MLKQLKEDEMSHEETLAGIADGLLDEFGEELTKVVRKNKMSRNEYPKIFIRVVGKYFKQNRVQMRSLKYGGVMRLVEDLKPHFHESVHSWNEQEVLPLYHSGQIDPSEFFDSTVEALADHTEDQGRDIWKGILREFGGLLYPASKTYANMVGYVARYFMKVRLVNSYEEGVKLAKGMHYESLYEDVLVTKKRGSKAGYPRRVREVDPRFLGDKVEKFNRDFASFDRPGTEMISDDIGSRDSHTDIEARELVEVLRKNVASGGETRRKVFELVISGWQDRRPLTITEIARRVGVSHQTVSIHMKEIRRLAREILQES
jgi:DNA-binding transcriptional ArsR family regulator